MSIVRRAQICLYFLKVHVDTEIILSYVCDVYFLLTAVVFQLVKSHIKCDFYNCVCPTFAVSGGTATACSQPCGGKDNVSKHLHSTSLHWGQHWPTGRTTPDIEEASVQWIWNRQMVHELKCWVHPGFTRLLISAFSSCFNVCIFLIVNILNLSKSDLTPTGNSAVGPFKVGWGVGWFWHWSRLATNIIITIWLLQCFEIIQGWHNFKIDWLETN